MPTSVMWPFGQVTAAARARVPSAPDVSVDDHVDASPAGEVGDLGGGVLPGQHPVVGADLAASCSASLRWSTAITVAGDSALRNWMAMWPRPPAPMATAVEPGMRRGESA
jgi:hypothetical protein